MNMPVMFRRDGRVEIHGRMMTENEAIEWFQQRGYDDLVKMTRKACADGRRFCRKRKMTYYDSIGNEEK